MTGNLSAPRMLCGGWEREGVRTWGPSLRTQRQKGQKDEFIVTSGPELARELRALMLGRHELSLLKAVFTLESGQQ